MSDKLPVKVFISYARKDAQFWHELSIHLAILRNQSLIEPWYDGAIDPGEEWEAEIKKQLRQAQIILLLVSADFLQSEYIWRNELAPAMARHEAGDACVIPVILRPTGWKGAPFAKLQALPKDALPITKWSDRDEAYVSVSDGVEAAALKLQAKSQPQPEQSPSTSDLITVLEPPIKSKYHREELAKDIYLEMVSIPAGSFLMGSPGSEAVHRAAEEPQHMVNIQSFLMGQCPVTQAQWAAVAQYPKVKIDLKPDPSQFKGAKRPVERVNWYEAEEFCARLSKLTGKRYRLPSEAQWEYACRAGTTTPYFFGENITPELANYNQTREETTEVGSFPANAFGLYDMHGNVWEWCADHWHDSYEGAPVNGSEWLSSDQRSARLVRGGSWRNDPPNSRSAYRIDIGPHYGSNFNGFRCVLAP